MDQRGLVQVPARFRIEFSQGGHRYDAGHGISDDKFSEWISENREFLVVRARKSRVYVPLLDFISLYI